MAAPSSSVTAVITALAGNFFVTIIKFIAFVLSGSGAMLSESIHSLADTGNQLLLWLGLKRASKKSDDEFHYGYGGERFIFGILSASGIFFVGCGVTVLHGIQGLFNPHMPEIGFITFAVLGVSAVIEASVLLFAVRAISKEKKEMPFFLYLKEKADPAAVAILLEDSVAVSGLFIAAGGILASHFTQNPLFDSLGSILIGLLLGYVAVYLISQNRKLLLGQAVPEGVEEKFTELIRQNPMVWDVHDIKTRQLTPESYSMKAEITVNYDFLAEKVGQSLPQELSSVAISRAKVLKMMSRRAAQVISEEISSIERSVQAVIPEARYIDLEIDQNPSGAPEEESEA